MQVLQGQLWQSSTAVGTKGMLSTILFRSEKKTKAKKSLE